MQIILNLMEKIERNNFSFCLKKFYISKLNFIFSFLYGFIFKIKN